MDKLGQGTIVYFKINDTEYGSGKICGIANTLPNQIFYIVELEKRETPGLIQYPYKCIVLPDSLFEPLHR